MRNFFSNYSFSLGMRPALMSAAALCLGLAAGCSYSHGDPAPECDVARETITYAAVISPIFNNNCRMCHSANSTFARDFSTFSSIDNYPQSAMLGYIRHESGFSPMPKGRAKLSDCDIKRIEAWYALGKPQ